LSPECALNLHIPRAGDAMVGLWSHTRTLVPVPVEESTESNKFSSPLLISSLSSLFLRSSLPSFPLLLLKRHKPLLLLAENIGRSLTCTTSVGVAPTSGVVTASSTYVLIARVQVDGGKYYHRCQNTEERRLHTAKA
jgi:hypothetical protein